MYLEKRVSYRRLRKEFGFDDETLDDVARLRRHQGRRQEAAALLTPILGWFTEGFDTADLKDAKTLLDQLTEPAIAVEG